MKRGNGRPLDGVRVLEFGQVASVPFTGMLLADLGADVVKIEPPEGDQMRQWPPLATDGEGNSFSYNFASLNRNKRSVRADLRDEGEAAQVHDLVRVADVVVENYRPGGLAKLGFGYAELQVGHRGLIYCSVSGYGSVGPYAGRPAYDVVIQAVAGLMNITGDPDGPPAKAGVPVADFVAGLYAALSISAVIPGVKASGQSQYIECPMLDCLLAISALQTSEYWGSGQNPQRLGSSHPRNAPYMAYSAKDHDIVIAAGNDRLWARACEALECTDLVEDPRFATQAARVENQQVLNKLLSDVIGSREASVWLGRLVDFGVPCGPVNEFSEILGSEQIQAAGLVRTLSVPVAGTTPTTVFPGRFEGTEPRLDSGPPRLGEGTDEVLAEWLGDNS